MKLRNILVIAALAAASLVFPAGADAQQADTLRVSTALWTACPGGRVQLFLRGPETVTGRCGPVADGRLEVRTQDAVRQVELSEVHGVSVRKSRIAEGVVLLGLAGFAVGYSFGIDGPEPVCVEGGCTRESREGAAGRGGGIGAVVGAAVGALVGSRLMYWQERYP